MTAWAIVLNPIHASGHRRLAELTAHLDARGIPWTLHRTTPVHEGEEQAAAAVCAGAARIVVVGGDGTVRSAVRGMISATGGKGATGVDPPPLVLLPTGTANLFARNLGIRPGPVDDFRLFAAEVRRADVGLADIRTRTGAEVREVFLAAAGLGHDASTIMGLGDRAKRALGWPAYLLAGLPHLADAGRCVQVRFPGGEFRGPAWSVLAGNVPGLPGLIRVFPHAAPESGDLELLVCTPRSVGDWARIARFGVCGRTGAGLDGQAGAGALAYHRCGWAEITPVVPAPTHLDGEPFPAVTRLRVSVLPGALPVVA